MNPAPNRMSNNFDTKMQELQTNLRELLQEEKKNKEELKMLFSN